MNRKAILPLIFLGLALPIFAGCDGGGENTVIQPGTQTEMTPEEQAEYEAEQKEMEAERD